MSRHYLVLNQKVLGSSRASIDTIARELDAKNPALAARFRSIDFDAIIRLAVKESIAEAAKVCGVNVSETYDNSDRYGDRASGVPEGTSVLGVLTDGEAQLGICIKPDGSLASFRNRWDTGRAVTTDWERAFEAAYRVVAMRMILSIVSGETPRVIVTPEVTILEQTLPGRTV